MPSRRGCIATHGAVVASYVSGAQMSVVRELRRQTFSSSYLGKVTVFSRNGRNVTAFFQRLAIGKQNACGNRQNSTMLCTMKNYAVPLLVSVGCFAQFAEKRLRFPFQRFNGVNAPTR